jgi:hypothetical protein
VREKEVERTSLRRATTPTDQGQRLVPELERTGRDRLTRVYTKDEKVIPRFASLVLGGGEEGGILVNRLGEAQGRRRS